MKGQEVLTYHGNDQLVWQTLYICIKALYAIKIHHLIYIGFC
jgi:hypothetical protein